MQFKLLNFQKIFTNFSSNLIGIFIPIIIYNETQNLSFALFMLFISLLIRILFLFVLRNLLIKKAYLFMALRSIPIVLKYVFIILISVNVWVGVLGHAIFEALSYVLKHVPNEVVYNSSTINESKKTLGTTIMFDMIGVAIAQIFSGYFLDNFNYIYLALLSLILFVIGNFPLQYSNYKKQKNSGVKTIVFDTTEKMSKHNSKLLKQYNAFYILFYMFDAVSSLTSLYIFINNGSFLNIAILFAIMSVVNGFSGMFSDKFRENKHIRKIVILAIFLLMLSVVSIPFAINYTAVLYIIYLVNGICYPIVNVYIYGNVLKHYRTINHTNKAITDRLYSNYIGYSIPFGLAALFGVFPLFFVISGALATSGIILMFNKKL